MIVVNDQSGDRTAEILAELAARIPKLRVMTTGDLPAGWVGKNYAVSLGTDTARGDWLLFTDADTYHYPGSTRRALSDAVEHDAALVSYSPEQEMETWWERALIPVVFWRLSKKYSFEDVSNPSSPQAAANGQYLLICRSVYTEIGGHAAVAGEILEDVALARRTKGAGRRVFFSSGAGIVRTRMYRSFGGMWEGWTKNLHLLMGSQGTAMRNLVVWCGIMLGGAILGRIYFDEAAWLGLLAPAMFVAILCGQYALYLRQNRYPLSYIRYSVPGVCLYLGARVVSWWKNRRGMVEWKGRTYRTKAA